MPVGEEYQKMLARMTDPAAMQMAYISGWVNFTGACLRAWGRIAETNIQFYARQESVFRRAAGRKPTGAALTDQYGKRVRDINVERV